MVQSNPVPSARRAWRAFVVLIAGASLLGAIWMSFRQAEETGPPASRTVIVAPPVSRASGGLAAAPRMADEIPSASATPSPGMKHALALADGAVVRGVEVFSRQLGISCGEVSPDGSSSGFKPFFYISSMKTGRVDDGTEEFRSHAANVCVARS